MGCCWGGWDRRGAIREVAFVDGTVSSPTFNPIWRYLLGDGHSCAGSIWQAYSDLKIRSLCTIRKTSTGRSRRLCASASRRIVAAYLRAA